MTTHELLTLPGRITSRSTPASDDLLSKIRKRQPAGAPEIDASRLFCWSATVSDDTLDTFFTKMHETTLRAYARDLQDGTPWIDGHNIHRVPLGSSISGRYVAGSPSRVEGDFYLIRGTTTGAGVTADDLADLIAAGIATDCSVGFTPGHFECNLCQGDPFDWLAGNCVHIPGVPYRGEGYKQIATDGSGTLAWCWVMEGHLREVSSVYKGANSGSKVTGVLPLSQEKASRLMSAGTVDRRLEPVLTRALAAPNLPAQIDPADLRLIPDLYLYRQG